MMAGERTLVQIAATSAAPNHLGTAGTNTEAFVRFVSTHGPYKTETLLFQLAAGDDFKADDTFKSQLAHPLFAIVTPASDANATAAIYSVEVNSLESNANFKTITLRDAHGITGIGVVITVYGY
jgi:hypothetical protein